MVRVTKDRDRRKNQVHSDLGTVGNPSIRAAFWRPRSSLYCLLYKGHFLNMFFTRVRDVAQSHHSYSFCLKQNILNMYYFLFMSPFWNILMRILWNSSLKIIKFMANPYLEVSLQERRARTGSCVRVSHEAKTIPIPSRTSLLR